MASTLEGVDKHPECSCVICRVIAGQGLQSFDFEEKKKIICEGRPVPTLGKLNKQTKSCVRHFQSDIYTKCEWLAGCEERCALFCWPCVLFCKEKFLWNKQGFSDLNNLHKLMKRHSISKAHIESIIREKTFGANRREHGLDTELKIQREQHNLQVRKNRDVLKRLIDAVCFLAEQELSFRGHDESEDSVNRGNYVGLINLLSKYDETLRVHIGNSTVFKGTSNVIQNELISCVGELVLNEIRREIKEASFVAIIIDETIDVKDISHLSVIVRYFTKKGDIKERFLGFQNIDNQRTANALYNIVQTTIDELDCGTKLIGQSYNGAVVKAGELGRLQTQVKEKYENALFVHFMAQKLNLMLQQSTSNIKECRVFFSILSGLSSFLSKSSKRSTALDLEIHKRSPKVAPTRWNYNGRLVQTVLQYRQPLIDFFENVLQNDDEWDHETVVCSRGYVGILRSDITFNFLLVMFSDLFPRSDNLFSILPHKSFDIDHCVNKFNEFCNNFLKKRESFDMIWKMVEDMDIEVKHRDKRICLDNADVKDEELYYRRLFFDIIDNIYSEMDVRFGNLGNLKFLELVNLSTNKTVDDDAFASLKQNYSQYFDFIALRSELSAIYTMGEGFKSSVIDLWKSIKEFGLEQACAETFKLCELVLTIPVTSTSGERSFSAPKRIKTYVKNSNGQERLSKLAVISIEKELVRELSRDKTFYDNVIDEFAKKNRRISLHYK